MDRWPLRIALSLLPLLVAALARGDERPPLTELLPPETVAYLHVPSCRALAIRAGETAPARLDADPELTRFAAGFSRTFFDFLFPASRLARDEAGDTLGHALRDATARSLGEALAAWIRREDGSLAAVLVVDADDDPDGLRPLFDARRGQLERDAAQATRESLSPGELTAYRADDGRMLGVVAERDGLYVFADDPAPVRDLFAAIDGAAGPRLAAEPQFSERMAAFRARCGDDWQAEWYVDPVALYRGVVGDNPIFGLEPAAVPALGFDGLHGLVGRLTLATRRYDALVQTELWLDQPRAGAAALVALSQGDVAAEAWAPREAATYFTVRWDAPETRRRLADLIDSFRGPGAGEELLAGEVLASVDQAQLDALLRSLAGRFSYVAWFDGPPETARLRRLWGVHMLGGDAPRRAAEALASAAGGDYERREHLGLEYFVRRGLAADYSERTTAYCALGEILLIGDAAETIERAIATERGESPPLAEELDYKLFAGRQRRLAGKTPAGLVHFHRPEAFLRHYHALASGEDARTLLDELAVAHPVYRALARAVDAHPLPPLEVFQPYLAPVGGTFGDDGTVLRYTFFAQRRRGPSPDERP